MPYQRQIEEYNLIQKAKRTSYVMGLEEQLARLQEENKKLKENEVLFKISLLQYLICFIVNVSFFYINIFSMLLFYSLFYNQESKHPFY